MSKRSHKPCCSSHGVDMSCARYRRTHFVEVRPCCAFDAERMAEGLDSDDSALAGKEKNE